MRILAITNVGPSILDAYLRPLASLEEIDEVVVVRDRSDVEPGDKMRIVTPAPWWPVGTLGKLAARHWLLRGEAADRPPDLLMTVHWFPDGPGVMRLGRRLGVPVVTNIIGSRAELLDGGHRVAVSRAPHWVRRQAQEYQRSCLDEVAAVTFTGGATADWFRAAGVRRPRFFVLHAGVDRERLRGPEGSRDIDIAYIGRVDVDKRADRLLRLLAEVGRRRPGTRATLIGIREEAAATLPEYSAARAVLGSGLKLAGWVESVASVLARAKVLVLSSDSEGRALAMLEAMVCGAVPVVTDVGDLREALDNGRAGVVVPWTEDEEVLVTALADAVCRLLEDAPTREEFASRGAHQVRIEHDPRRTRQEWRAVLASVRGPGTA